MKINPLSQFASAGGSSEIDDKDRLELFTIIQGSGLVGLLGRTFSAG
jgi:hypothetical protein